MKIGIYVLIYIYLLVVIPLSLIILILPFKDRIKKFLNNIFKGKTTFEVDKELRLEPSISKMETLNDSVEKRQDRNNNVIDFSVLQNHQRIDFDKYYDGDRAGDNIDHDNNITEYKILKKSRKNNKSMY